MKKRPKKIINKWTITIVVIILILVGYYLSHRNKAPSFESTTVVVGNVIEKVGVTGQVLPVDKADLSFEKSGVVKKLYVIVGDKVKRGDHLASLDNADDLAALQSQQAQLAELSRGLRPAEYSADQAAVTLAKTNLTNARTTGVNALRDGYVKVQTAIVSGADAFFDNPQSSNPTINISTYSADFARNIGEERLVVTESLDGWQTIIASASSTSDIVSLIAEVQGYLGTIKSFMSDLSTTVNALNPSNSGISQSAIDTDIAIMNTAMANLTASITALSAANTSFAAAQSAYDQAVKQFELEQAGSSAETIASGAAKVAQAQAVVDEDTLLSPIDGTVTSVNPKLGEFVAAGSATISIQSVGDYKVEAYVPEADIAKVAIGDLASSTLDAYGSNIDFPEIVTMIDPAETVLQGVPTYKVTLGFMMPDTRIRSGMTSNIEIYTHEVDGVVEIPYRAVMMNATSTSARVVNPDGQSWTAIPVTVGLKGSNGMIEIVGGLRPGSKVVTYINQ